MGYKRWEGRRKKELGGCFTDLPKSRASHPPHSLFSEGLLCPALSIGLVYATHQSPFAVAIATTRGQFIKGEEVRFWGGRFPASVQSTAENKSPNTPEETRGKAFYQPKHRVGPEESRITATFLPCRKIIPEQLVGARKPHPCIPQITLSFLLLLPFA